MKIKIGSGLLLVNLLAALLISVIVFSLPDALRVVLGLSFILFFPGYMFILTLFPKKQSIGGIERVALSFGLSIAIVPLIGLILNYTWWGITVESILYSVTSFVFIMSILAWLRQAKLDESERFTVDFRPLIPGRSGGPWDKVLSVLLTIAILGTLGSLGYVIAKPKIEEKFTEFYILGLEGKASDYPKELQVGEEGRVIVGIVNREHEPVDYRVEITINGLGVQAAGPIPLAHEEKWERELVFVPTAPGENEKVEFILYKNGDVDPLLEPLHLWIKVTE